MSNNVFQLGVPCPKCHKRHLSDNCPPRIVGQCPDNDITRNRDALSRLAEKIEQAGKEAVESAKRMHEQGLGYSPPEETTPTGPTPGPWYPYENTVIKGNPKGQDVRAECDPSGRVCRDATWADAQLIAAAPALLHALELVKQNGFNDEPNDYGVSVSWCVDQAIRKARGIG